MNVFRETKFIANLASNHNLKRRGERCLDSMGATLPAYYLYTPLDEDKKPKRRNVYDDTT
jgi:hypothetical protein